MLALLRRRVQWEQENGRRLTVVIENIESVAAHFIRASCVSTSLLLYLVYQIIRLGAYVAVTLVEIIFSTPTLVREVAPGQEPINIRNEPRAIEYYLIR